MRIKKIFAEYRQAEVVAANLSSKTFESYFYAEKLVVDFFGDIELGKLRPEDVRAFYEHLLGWQKPDTARGNIVCLRSVIKYAKRRGLKVMSPEDIKVPKREKRTIEYLTQSEVEEFVAVVGQPMRGYSRVNRVRNVLIVELLYATGLRVSELCRLNRNSFRDRQTVVVGKSKMPRPVYITKEVEELIDKYLKLRTDSSVALLVSEQTGERIKPGTIRRVFANACDRSEFSGVHPHTLRHSFATKMLTEGVNLRYIADLMGHESLDTTKIYTHYTNPQLRSIYENVWRT